MRKLTGMILFIVCIPLIGSILIKPDKRIWKQTEYDTSVINESFTICVKEEVGTFYYKPEKLTELLLYCVIPEDTAFSSSEDYIVRMDEAWDPEQEYLKALSIVCRSNIVYAWEAEQRPDILEFDKIQFEVADLHKIIQTNAVYNRVLMIDDMLSSESRRVKLNEIRRAVDATQGAVITRDGKVITAPFFTTEPSDMLVLKAGNGVGFSLNYAYELAVQGRSFYEILQYFYRNFRVTIYE